MAKYAWCTDVHLNFIDDEQRLVEFANSLVVDNPTGIFVTGDISVTSRLIYHLSVLEKVVQRPIYYVLGNHDFYGGDITAVRKTMRELTNMSSYLKYLPTVPYLALTSSTAIVGHDGWYDALYGDWKNSNFMMTDWDSIADFLPMSGGKAGMRGIGGSGNFDKGAIVGQARKLAHEGVTHVMQGIKSAVRYHKNIVVLTHFPPFQESHIYQGNVGNAAHQPWYTSKMMGDLLLQAAAAYPKVNFTVLCGHTHGKYSGKFAKNLTVHVGGAEYYQPQLQSLIEIE